MPAITRSASAPVDETSEHIELGAYRARAPSVPKRRTSGLPFPRRRETLITRVHNDPTKQGPTDQGIQDVDEPGREMAPGATFWQLYTEEATELDDDMLDGWNRTMDVLLVFAALFSAISTTLLVESYRLLAEDPDDTATDLLLDIARTLSEIAAQGGLQGGAEAAARFAARPQIQDPGDNFKASTEMVWVNAFWFCSLTLALVVSLLAMLAKQWIYEYSSGLVGAPRNHARLRQFRYDGLRKWRLQNVLTILPILLHVSLALFLVGLVLWIYTLNKKIAFATLSIVGITFAAYLLFTLLPLFYIDCPFKNPLSEYIGISINNLRRRLEGTHLGTEQKRLLSLGTLRESTVVNQKADKVDARALGWLMNNSGEKVVVNAAVKAIAGLPRDFKSAADLREMGFLELVQERFLSCFERNAMTLQLINTRADDAAQYARALVRLTPDTKQLKTKHEEILYKIAVDLNDLEMDKVPGGPLVVASLLAALMRATAVNFSYDSRWLLKQIDTMLEQLTAEAVSQTSLSRFTQCILIDAIIELVPLLEKHLLSTVRPGAIGALLQILPLNPNASYDDLRDALSEALRVLVFGETLKKPNEKDSDDEDEDPFAEEDEETLDPAEEPLLIALSRIIQRPDDYEVSPDLVDFATQEVCSWVQEQERLDWLPTALTLDTLAPALIASIKVTKSDDTLCQSLHALYLIAGDGAPGVSPDLLRSHYPFLVQVLESSPAPGAALIVAKLLRDMASAETHAADMMSSGAIEALIRHLSSMSDDLQLAETSSAALFVLVTHEYKNDFRDHAINNGLLDSLASFAISGNMPLQELFKWSSALLKWSDGPLRGRMNHTVTALINGLEKHTREGNKAMRDNVDTTLKELKAL